MTTSKAHEGVDAPGLGIDPVTFEVLKNTFLNITEEMAYAVRRAAYSTNIKTRADFSCAFFDRQLRCIAQSFSEPPHLGSLRSVVPTAVAEFGPENFKNGDMIIVNDPHRGNSHLNDVALIAAVHVDGRPFGYVANIAHHVDVGGSAPASLGLNQEIFQEGIILPGSLLVRRGKLDEGVMKLILSNVRAPRETGGDFRAQIAANMLGARRLVETAERHHVDALEDWFDELLDYTERWTRAEFARLPKGEFSAEGFRDSDGFSPDPVKICVTLTFDGTSITLDVSGSDPQTPSALNATRNHSFAALAYIAKCLVDENILINDGFYRALDVTGPDGLVVTALRPAAVVGAWEVGQQVVETMWRALAPTLPKMVPAGSKGIICNLGWGGIDPNRGEVYCYMETVGGGNGARWGKDGPDAVQTNIHNTENAPIEEVEINYPFRIARYELIQDSGGAGQHRGGLSLRREYEFPFTETKFTIMSDGTRFPPKGLFGGADGRPAHFILDPGGKAEELPSKVTVDLPIGGRIQIETPGGGGYGAPLDRPIERVIADVRSGKVSVGAARESYGVVLAPDSLTLDEPSTAEARSRMSAGRNSDARGAKSQ